MFVSGISADDLIAEVKSEVDVGETIADSRYKTWLKTLTQMLYSEIIKEHREYSNTVSLINQGTKVDISIIDTLDKTTDKVRFEDIEAVYINDTELSRVTMLGGISLRNTYWKTDNNTIAVNYDNYDGIYDLKIIYDVRPSLRYTPKKEEGVLHIPAEQLASTLALEQILWDDITTVFYWYPSFSIDLYSALKFNQRDINRVKVVLRIPGMSGWSEYICEKDKNIEKGGNSYTIAEGDAAYLLTVKLNNDDLRKSTTIKSDVEYRDWILSSTPSLEVKFLYDGDSYSDVPLPYEFADVARCKLKGEAYKLMNDDYQAAKWLDEYNIQLENFKAYIETNKGSYGR